MYVLTKTSNGDLKCENCGSEMKVDFSTQYCSYPPQYKAKCNKCDNSKYISETQLSSNEKWLDIKGLKDILKIPHYEIEYDVLDRIDIACGQTYLLQLLPDETVLEVGDVYMGIEKSIGSRPYEFKNFEEPSDYNKRVLTICTMSGCTNGCSFCSSAKTFKRLLSPKEIVGQVEALEQLGLDNGRPHLNEAKELRILLTRMGEPLLNIVNVMGAIRMLKLKYPKVIIGFSTSFTSFKNMNILIEEGKDILQYIDFQFSMHSTDNAERKMLFHSHYLENIQSVLHFANSIYEITRKKVGLNFILFKNYTYDLKSYV